MNYFKLIILSIGSLAFISACSAMQPMQTQRVQPGIESESNNSLKKLPPPEKKVVAAVYRFSDQTGQYKSQEQGASWSTAVTQGATSILIKSMTNSGWFVPIERENVSNLMNERKIINSTRAQNGDNNGLPPLLFAGVLLEGGIIGYDTNVITGGAGIRYLGMGGSGEFRKDQVTIYLRAVSTQTGRILNTVHTTKSIISQKLDGGVFRFVDENKLLEAEAGYSFNEPPVLAVTEAIDEALKTLIIEGVNEGVWIPQDQELFNSYTEEFYKNSTNKTNNDINFWGLTKNHDLRTNLNISANFNYGTHIGNYPNAEYWGGGSLQIEYFLSPSIAIVGNGQRSKISTADIFSQNYYGLDLQVRKYFTPHYPLSPYVSIGSGAIIYERSPQLKNNKEWIRNGPYPTANAQAGLDYKISDTIGFRIGFDYRYLLDEKGLDGIQQGDVFDQQWNIVTGFTFSPKFWR